MKRQHDDQEMHASVDAPVRQAAYTGILLPSQAIRGDGPQRGDQVGRHTEQHRGRPGSARQHRPSPRRFAYPVDTAFLPGPDIKVIDKMRQLDADFERFKIDLARVRSWKKVRLCRAAIGIAHAQKRRHRFRQSQKLDRPARHPDAADRRPQPEFRPAR